MEHNQSLQSWKAGSSPVVFSKEPKSKDYRNYNGPKAVKHIYPGVFVSIVS